MQMVFYVRNSELHQNVDETVDGSYLRFAYNISSPKYANSHEVINIKSGGTYYRISVKPDDMIRHFTR